MRYYTLDGEGNILDADIAEDSLDMVNLKTISPYNKKGEREETVLTETFLAHDDLQAVIALLQAADHYLQITNGKPGTLDQK